METRKPSNATPRKRTSRMPRPTRPQPITPTEARRSLWALEVLSHNITEPPIPRKKPIQHEAEIQKALFEWAKLSEREYPELRLMFHIPNEGRRSIAEGGRLKQQGLKAGLPDICLPVARGGYHSLYIELKSDDGRLQASQKEWLNELEKAGSKACVCFGLKAAIDTITDYLDLPQCKRG